MAGSDLQKKIMAKVYGFGGAIVIIGALFKILHLEIDLGGFKLGGGLVLGIGLVTEAIIFILSAFEPIPQELDWSKVFPELAGGEPRSFAGVGTGIAASSQTQASVRSEEETKILKESLSEKLDGILKEAKLDANLMQSLASSIRNFEGAVKEIAPVTDAIASSRKYGEEMSLAAVHLESLNSLYKIQLERTEQQMNAQEGMVDNLNSLNAEVNSFKGQLKTLNGVYGGMLSAMGVKN